MPRQGSPVSGPQRFAGLLLVWLVLDGSLDAASLATGTAAAALGAWAGSRLAPPGRGRLRLRALPGFAAYFVVESLRGALDVAWRALHPRLPIEPELATHPIALPPGKPRTMLVSVVSLLPGTLSAELSQADNSLCVHAITPHALAGVRELESRIAAVFGLATPERGP